MSNKNYVIMKLIRNYLKIYAIWDFSVISTQVNLIKPKIFQKSLFSDYPK